MSASNIKHSPAPWRSARGNVIRIFSSDAKSVCCIHRRGRQGMTPEVAANCDLVEAAPMLLHAAQWALDHYDGKHMGANTIPLPRAAIAKATGAA